MSMNHETLTHSEHLAGIAALMVDGDRTSTNLVREVLGPFGVAVVSVGSAEEADVLLPAITPEVLLCDLVLPGEGGLAFIRRIRGRLAPAIRDVPAIAMTSSSEFDAGAAHRAGFDVLLRKPLDPERLSESVALLVARGRRAMSVGDQAE
jgi:two-component system CheB/CheR fusion protein